MPGWVLWLAVLPVDADSGEGTGLGVAVAIAGALWMVTLLPSPLTVAFRSGPPAITRDAVPLSSEKLSEWMNLSSKGWLVISETSGSRLKISLTEFSF